jgi:hypothetical protein
MALRQDEELKLERPKGGVLKRRTEVGGLK